MRKIPGVLKPKKKRIHFNKISKENLYMQSEQRVVNLENKQKSLAELVDELRIETERSNEASVRNAKQMEKLREENRQHHINIMEQLKEIKTNISEMTDKLKGDRK